MSATPTNAKPVKVRLEDLARAANVSISTASLALRGDPAVSPATRKRITSLQKKLGYVRLRQGAAPSPQLARHRFHFVLVNRLFESDPYSAILDGVLAGCKRHKCDLSMSSCPDVAWDPQELFLQHPERPSGFILAGDVTEKAVGPCESLGIPYVVVGSHRFGRVVHSVQVDLEAIAMLMVERAIRDGRRRFAYVAKALGTHFDRRLLSHLRLGLEAHGLELPSGNVHIDGMETSKLAEVSRTLLASSPGVDAIFTSLSDHADLYRAAFARENRAPAIYSVASSTVVPDATRHPNLNTGQNRLGQVAVDRLCQRLLKDGALDTPYVCLLPPIGWLDQVTA